MFDHLGQYEKAKEYLERVLVNRNEIGNRKMEAVCYRQLGTVSRSLEQFDKAKEYLQKALAVSTETGDRGEGTDYRNLGVSFSWSIRGG